jgi:SsrA-binding protein
MKHKKSSPDKIVNRRAKFDYELEDQFVVGIVLNGRETKALRMRHGHLRGAYVTVKEGELWLTNATITSTSHFVIPEDEQTQPRKLLATKKEIEQIMATKQQGRTVVPLEFLVSGRYIKLRIAVGRGKKRYDKRENIKEREQDIAMDRAIKFRSR